MKSIFTLSLFLGSVTAHLRSHRKLHRPRNRDAILEQEYIIVFDETVDDVDTKITSVMEGVPECSVKFTYKNDLKGVAVENLPDLMLWKILDDPEVLFAEEDQVVKAVAVQEDATWGLDRIDEESLPLDDNYRYDYTGEGVTAFVVDTGIRTSHLDFGGRARCGFTAFRSRGCQDDVGHGTHVAGTVGSSTYGVAKSVDIVAVKVLNSRGEGSTSGVIAGIDYIRRQKQNNPTRPMVANLSLGGGESPALDAAVDEAVAAGVVFAVAAGNDNANACFSSPASAKNPIVVGSSNSQDRRSDFSNFGSCVDIFAPGSSITSLWAGSDTQLNRISGTSMASPHVAGVAALILESDNALSPAQVWRTIQDNAVSGKLASVGRNSPNLLLNTPMDPNADNDLNNGGIDEVNNGVPADDENREPEPQCRGLFSRCSSRSDCCSNSCRFGGICFFF